jgi:hypothetical protein
MTLFLHICSTPKSREELDRTLWQNRRRRQFPRIRAIFLKKERGESKSRKRSTGSEAGDYIFVMGDTRSYRRVESIAVAPSGTKQLLAAIGVFVLWTARLSALVQGSLRPIHYHDPPSAFAHRAGLGTQVALRVPLEIGQKAFYRQSL